MADIVVNIENLSKLYRLGEVGTGTICHDLNRWWAKIRGKEDPFSQVAQTNDRTKRIKSDFVWALKGISLSVGRGDIIGIIGANGAGKSTLLKLISRITSPTTGLIKAKGRIASLLEIGTGMHPDMTARENVFLNGAIMGMKRHEMQQRFEQIIDFAGCSMYVDTPIKRFSSGMRVRLGFAVAAFLEPEILIIDEVLAVGDAEFQKKCLGKMSDFATGGRTVLFVSHNMNSINNICSKCICLENGKLIESGKTSTVINNYLQKAGRDTKTSCSFPTTGNRTNQFTYVSLKSSCSDNKSSIFNFDDKFFINIHFLIKTSIVGGYASFIINNGLNEVVFVSDIRDNNTKVNFETTGYFKTIVEFPSPLLIPGKYSLSVALGIQGRELVDFHENLLNFEIVDPKGIRSQRGGHIYVPLNWRIQHEK